MQYAGMRVYRGWEKAELYMSAPVLLSSARGTLRQRGGSVT